MANADNGLVSPDKPGEQPGAPARTRAGKPAGPAFKPMQHEDMDPQEFAAMLDIYDDSFRNMAEGEVVKGTVLKVTDTRGRRRRRLQVRRPDSDSRVPRRERSGDRAGRRRRRRAARAHRGSRRPHRAVAREGREDEDLGRGREGLRRSQGRHRPRHRAHQGRSRGGHRRPRVPARARRSTCGRSATSMR